MSELNNDIIKEYECMIENITDEINFITKIEITNKNTTGELNTVAQNRLHVLLENRKHFKELIQEFENTIIKE